ncbi:hypothetical protein MMC08_004905 [Hypocenomyce scalaris]|nr:hypothetical protein [Hypocenomyce scalaris]
MKGIIFAIAISALLGSAGAGSLHERRHAHQVFHELRRGEASNMPENANLSSSSSYPTPSSSSFSSAAAVAARAAPQSSSSSSSGSSAPMGSTGSQWCMTYSPYNADSSCKDASSVASDISTIAAKGFTSVRLYSTDCSGLPNVGSVAASLGLKLVLGIYISDTGISVAAEQISAITQWANGDYSNVEMIVVGNEAVFNGYCTASALAAFITSAKSTFAAAGYTGPVTTTEPMNILQQYADTLCPVVDVAASNIHPYFNSATSASQAGAFVASSLQELAALCPGGKEAWNLETGWPHAGDANGAAVPGVQEQETAIASIRSAAGGQCAFFSFVDDLWQAPGPYGVEQSWGCSQLFSG